MYKDLEAILKENYSNNTLVDFETKTRKIYELFKYPFIQKNIAPIPNERYNSLVWLNDTYKARPLSNLTLITFDLVYPTLIAKLANVNIEYFNEVYNNLIQINRSEQNYHLKRYINMAYGCLGSNRSNVHANNMKKVTAGLTSVLSEMILTLGENLVYIDTDMVIFRNFKEIEDTFLRVMNNINVNNLNFDVDSSDFAFFVAKKRYMMERDGNIKIQGLTKYDKDGISRGGYIHIYP